MPRRTFPKALPRVGFPVAVLFVCATLPASSPAQSPDHANGNAEAQTASEVHSTLLNEALRSYRRNNFEEAAETYQAVLKHNPSSAEGRTGLARCYLKLGKIEQAYETAAEGLKAAPDSQILHVVRGEICFRQGKMHEAEQEFLGAVNSDSPHARAYLGLARISEAISMHARARRMLERAHELDPSDPEIEWRWLKRLEPSSRAKALAAYISAAVDAGDAESIEEHKGYLELLKQEQEYPLTNCTLVAAPATVRSYLWPLFAVPSYIGGYGPEVRINARQFRLLLDTGASGILLNPRAAERAGILPAKESKMVGIGDKGDGDLYVGYADSVRIGSLEFKNCPVQVTAKEAIGQDGLIGADMFAHYLVTIDYPAHELRLSQLPQRPSSGPPTSRADSSAPLTESDNTFVDDASRTETKEANAEDRYIAPEMRSYTTVYRFGHMLLVPTLLNGSASKLFLIDSGSDHNYISPNAAREVTRVEEDKDTRVLGVKGRVKEVFRANKATLSFGRYKQENQDLIAFDLSKLSEDAGTEISGTLGFSLLRVLKLTIDYRDGLVDFSYDSRRVH